MDDRKLINQEADEMEASSNDSQDSVPENPLPLGGQALPSFGQDASLPPEPAAEQSSPMKRSSRALIESTPPKKSKTEPTRTSRKRERMGSNSSENEDLRKQEEVSSPSHEGVSREDALSERPLNEQGEAEGEQGVEEEPETVLEISKYASNAQVLLLSIFRMSDIVVRLDIYREFDVFFKSLARSSCTEEVSVINALQFYIEQMETFFETSTSNCTWDSQINQFYRDFFVIVGDVLCYTVSQASLEFDKIMENYEKFVELYRKFINHWKNVNLTNLEGRDSVEGSDSEVTVEAKVEYMGKLLLRMKNAFRELLMHIGEKAEEEMIDEYEATYLREEDLIEDRSFLRRQIL